MSVNPHLTVVINAVEVYKNLSSTTFRRQGKGFPVPSCSTRQVSCTTRIIPAEWAFDTPVVWKIQIPPSGIVKCNIMSSGNFSFMEFPAVIEVFNDSFVLLTGNILHRNKQYAHEKQERVC